MIKSRKILGVFLASPSDLQTERQYARDCVDEWNEVNAERSGWFVELMGWEDTLPQAGRPQEIINQDVDKCVFFVGMMHRLWGNPTGSGATSGFHEEFERAATRFGKTGEPFISLFFKDMGDVSDPGDQLSKVIEFRRTVTDSKEYFYKSLPSDPVAWSAQFRRNIHKLIFNLIDLYTERGQSASDSDSVHTSTDVVPISQPGLSSKAKLSALQNLTAQMISERSDSEVSPVSVARLRLLSTSWQASGLAEAFLPTHDANVIYRLAAREDISRPEVMGLIETGLAYFSSGNAPIWRWILKEDPNLEFIRGIALFSNEEKARQGAFELLALADDDFGDLSSLLEEHFVLLSNSGKNAVLRYIARTASQKFETIAISEFRRGEYATQNTALLAICAVKGSLSAEAALKFLLEENVFPNGWDTSGVEDAVGRLDDEGLQTAILHREPEIRAMAVRALGKRNLISVALSSTLKSDPSAKVRVEAVKAARLAGEQISVADAATIIVRKSANALGAGSKDGEDEFEEYREAAMADLPDPVLELEANSYYTPAEAAYKALLSRYWKTKADVARFDIKDNFERHLSELARFYTVRYGDAAAELAKLTDNLKSYVVSKRIRSALDVFALKGVKEDVRLFRIAAKLPYFVLKRDDLTFFSRFGDWSDIPFLASSSRQTGGSILYPKLSCTEDDVAFTILKIAKNRIGECLKLDLPPAMKAAIVRHSSKAAFRRIPRDDIVPMLSDENDGFRRSISVRIAETYSKSEATEMMDLYLGQSYLYYNVIHWLDLRVSAPSATATFIAERANLST